ncbi:WhiB family transcriptional regulator [Aeromicrobium erythreum]|uniref:Transcriptional regulator WhiB n=1 Tax=Aeromicrobium erythreum TaxID=2041 RepID=A0A0U4CU20_9ACTN|nr:WhiB family transcriptional regulator [Aeromicrobium erythreum]ALX04301.1 transcription factor WhiB [Aeromicrobium erythreum]
MPNIHRLPMPLQEMYEWQHQGACANIDPAQFFSPDAERGVQKERREEAAKVICQDCPVIIRCRDHALSVQEPYGVWGGLSESDRREILATTPKR